MARIIHTTSDRQAAHLLCSLLTSRGIEARVLGDDRFGLRAVLGGDVALNVQVDRDEDEGAARAIIAEAQAAGDAPGWTCGACGETCPATFDLCWKCARARAEVALEGARGGPYRSGAPDVGPTLELPRAADQVTAPRRVVNLGLVVFLAIIAAAAGWVVAHAAGAH